MFKTKKDVDKHVTEIFSKIKNENERHLRGYNIAKQYYFVKDYETAKRYLAGFLMIKETNAPAHKLMGEIYEKTGQLEKALQSFKRSLELDERQNDIILKICELYCQLPVDPDRGKYWADRAEKLFPHNNIIFKLRECLVNGDGDHNVQEYEDLIINELLVRPHDVNLRIKLLKLYLDTERTELAYKHAIDVEKKSPYHDSVDWYYCLIDIYETYLEDLSHEYTPEICVHLLKALDRLVTLNFDDNHKVEKENRNERNVVTTSMASATTLQWFDKHLLKAWQLKHNTEAWKTFLSYMQGQLYFHMATVIFKRAKQEHGNQKEASRIGASLLLAAYSFKPHNLQSSWYLGLEPNEKNVYKSLHQQACYRLSQCGHVIMGLCREDRAKWRGRSRDYVATMQSKERIYQRVFNTKGPRPTGHPPSYFLEADIMSVMSDEFPDTQTLRDYDLIGHTLHASSLHHLVWLALQYYNGKEKVQPNYGFKVFDGLQYSVPKLEDPSPESLCFLDVEAFLYATVRCSALALEDHHSLSYISPDMPPYLPASICDPLCTPEQAEWWMVAYSLFTNGSSKNFGELRRKLQHGIEVIRVLGNHGMDVTLVVHLAQIFMGKASELNTQTSGRGEQSVAVGHLETRASLYWKTAVEMIEQMLKNVTIRLPKERLFPNYGRQLSLEEMRELLEEGKFFLACQLMNAGKYEEAISGFEVLNSPYASFYQALAYKKLAAEEFGNKPRESITSEMRSRHIILLTRARDALYLTLDRVRGDKKHPLNHDLPDIIEDIESLLARIDPDTAQRLEYGGSEDSFSPDSEEQDPDSCTQLADSTRVSKLDSSRPSTLSRMLNLHSSFDDHRKKLNFSPRQQGTHLIPSPERLDAQIRSIASWQDTLVKTILEQNKTLLDTNNAIVEGLKQNKAAIEQLTEQLQEFTKQIPSLTKDLRRQVRGQPASGEARSLPQNHKPAREEVEEDGDHDDDYYDGYYYEDDRDYGDAEGGDRENQEFRCNPAYAYPEPPLHNEYPYGNTTGIHGTSTITYAPPAGSGRGVLPQGSGYHSYYPPCSNLPGQPLAHGGGILHGQPHSVPTVQPPYFSHPPPPMFTGLPFSEGQKLPEFNFNVAAPPINGANVDDGSKFAMQQLPSFGPVNSEVVSSIDDVSGRNVPTQLTANGEYATSSLSPNASLKSHGLFDDSLTSLKIHSLFTEQQHAFTPTKSAAEVTSAAHAFQISLPPQAVVFPSPSVTQSKLFNSDSTNNANVSLTGNVTFNVDGSSGRRTSLRGTSEAEDSYQEEDSTSQDYKPVIPLPAEVEMKTGEEDEKVLFEERGKLFRYVNKEWKERGVGLIKILHNEQTGRSRILMRRDHVWKTCANHLIYRDMILTAAKNSDKAWLWGAQDYADGEVKTEQFCIKFKTREIALLFQEKFDWAKSLVSKTHTDSSLGANDKKNDSNLEMDGVTCAKGVVIDKTTESPSQHDFSALQNSESSSSSSKWIGGNSDASVRSGPGSFAPSIILGDNRNDHLSVATDSSTAPIIKPTTITILDKDNEISSHSGGDNFVFGGACAEPQPKSSGYEFGASSSKSRTVVPVLNIQSDINIIFGGFSFKAPPVLKQTKDDADNAVEKSKDATVANSLLSETAKVSPFAGFTFNLPPKDKVDNSAKPQNSTVSSFPGFSFNAKPSETMTSLTVLKDNKQSNVGKELDSKESTAFILGSGSSVSEMSFSNLAKGVSDTDAFKKDSSFEGFSGQGQKVFGDSSDATKGSHSHDEDFEPDVDFKPVVNLPQIIDLKTGEEDEEKLFGERAKLFRYNTESKEWKERGVGEIKILFNRLTKRLRILMRREQVFKLCANHYITRDMKLQPMATSDRAWVWYANDFSEGELRQEKLAVKFKSPEVASAFKEAFEKHQHEVFKEKTVDTPSKDISQVKPPSPKLKWSCASCYSRNNAEFSECLACKTPRPTTTQSSCIPAEALSELFKPSEGSWECSSCLVRNEKGQTNCVACHANKPGLGSSAPNIILTCAPSTKTTNSGPLSALFKPSEGSWECSSCLVRNEKTHVNCISCQAPKPGLAFHATVVSTPEASLSSSRSSEPPPLSALFKPSEGSWECSSCLVRNEKGRVNCISCETAKPGTGSPANTTSTPTSFLSTPPAFKFGFNKSGEGLAAPNTSGFSFEMSTPSFKFGIPQTSDITTTTTTSSPSSAVEFRFGTPQKFTFSFGGVRPLSPTKTPKSPIDDSTEGEGEDDTIGGESEGDSIYFHPQIPLPDKIEVRTGEEDEEILYCQRAKLFRLADGEWKERGLGDFKILLHRASSKFRFLMRRDQILKICCNHYLTPNITLRAKDDRSWLWYAYDFSDNETKCETLALRFKTPELAKTFKQTVDVVQQLMKDERLPLPVKDSSPAKTDSVSTFSFKAEDAQVNASPKSTFTFGDRFSSRVQKIGSRDFHFGASSEPTVSFNFRQQSKDSRSADDAKATIVPDDEIEVVFERRSSFQHEAKARSLMLPPNFYEYEKLPPCPGCRGCRDSSDDDHHDDSTREEGSEIEIVWESKPTEDQIEKALRLKLSPSFYLYENTLPCPGCRGCIDDIPVIEPVGRQESCHGDSKTVAGGDTCPTPSLLQSEKPKEDSSLPSFFSSSAQAVSFADLSKKAGSGFAVSDSKKGLTFEGAGSTVFGGGFAKNSSANDQDSDDNEDPQVQQPDIHFDPVMPLPKLITVTTGEEEEDKMFCSRCKLYRFDAKARQWKERGIGDIKILKHQITGRFRILMRWDQTHKICCNHALTVDMALIPLNTSSNSWCWSAYDFSEEKKVLEKFAVRFKNADIASDFRSCFQRCQEALTGGKS